MIPVIETPQDTPRTPQTSAEGAMRAPSTRFIISRGALPDPGTSSARSLSNKEWKSLLIVLPQTSNSGWVNNKRDREAQDSGRTCPSNVAIMELRRLTGLTWEQLARLFGTSRRSLHFWASGKPLNPTNEERLQRLISAIKQADRGSASENRTMLLRDHNGVIPFDLLKDGSYEKFRELVGRGRGRRRIPLTPLSQEAWEARKPLPPAELVGALQDRAQSRGRVKARPARTIKIKK